MGKGRGGIRCGGWGGGGGKLGCEGGGGILVGQGVCVGAGGAGLWGKVFALSEVC